MRIVLISRRIFKVWCEQSFSGHSAEVEHGIGSATHDAPRLAEPTKSMNYAWCSTRCDHSVAELVHENRPCAPGGVVGRGLCGGSRAVRGGRWPPPPRQRCRWRGRGSSLPSAATTGFVNCPTWPGAGAPVAVVGGREGATGGGRVRVLGGMPPGPAAGRRSASVGGFAPVHHHCDADGAWSRVPAAGAPACIPGIRPPPSQAQVRHRSCSQLP